MEHQKRPSLWTPNSVTHFTPLNKSIKQEEMTDFKLIFVIISKKYQNDDCPPKLLQSGVH